MLHAPCSFSPDVIVPFKIRENGIIEIGQYWGDEKLYKSSYKLILERVKLCRKEISSFLLLQATTLKTEIVTVERLNGKK